MNQYQSKKFFMNVDWITILIYMALCAIGWINIYSSVPNTGGNFNFAASYGRQLIFIITGLVIGLSLLLFDAKFLNIFAPIVYGATILLLILVLLIGNKVGGNQAWIAVGSFKLQPSEFAKFGTALLLARYIGSFNPKFTDFRFILFAALLVGLPLVLILLQPDTGSALVFFSLLFPLYREGLSGYFLLLVLGMITLFVAAFLVSFSILIPLILLVGGGFIYFSRRKLNYIITVAVICAISIGYLFFVKVAYNTILESHQRSRIEIMLGLKSDPQGAGYNVNQSKIAIGAGQLTGRGFMQGTQTKYGYVPEQSTDFIFSTIGEEWGFIGCAVVIGLFVFLLLRVVNLAERQRSTFSRVYGYCVASIIFFHVFINIGMTIGIVPVIGIPLPFISYGGSSLWSFTILLFIFLKLDSNRMGFV